MRTTLDIDDDVLLAAKERAARERTSIGAVVSRLARDGLTGMASTPAAKPGRKRAASGRFAVMPRRDEIVTIDKVRRLLDDEGA
jgi:hypothetical protein